MTEPVATAHGWRASCGICRASPGVQATARPLLAILLICATSLCAATSTPMEPTQLPADVRATIAQLQVAAETSDFATLRSLMTDQFIWSFGGDANADQAIAAWRADSSYLNGLRATLARGCRVTDPDEVECPGKGGGDFRAGLVKTPAGWRMTYLVAGDWPARSCTARTSAWSDSPGATHAHSHSFIPIQPYAQR